jgi:diacylglycerol O-acyltransferase
MNKHEPADLARLSLQDLTNLPVEAPNTPMHVGALGVLEGRAISDAEQRIRIDAIRADIEARLHLVPELRRVLRKTRPFQGHPLWVDDPGFRIENHVHRVELPPPGGEERALRFAERLMGKLMDRNHPLWQLWFLEGYGPGEVGVFLKLHHVLADGAAVLKIVSLLFDVGPGAVAPTVVAWSPAPPPAGRLLYRDNAARKIATLVRAALRLRHPVALARSAALWSVISEGFGAPRTSINRPIRSVAHAGGEKINDLVLNLIAGGLREVLVSRGESVEGVSMRASWP